MVFSSGETKFKVTISGGVAAFPETKTSSNLELLDYADMALYHSKENGRNKITLYGKKMI